MTITYSLATINARLQAVANQIDAGGSNGSLVLLANSTVISTVQLSRPCGTVSGGVLTFSGTLLDPAASASGAITTGRFQDSNGNIVASGLSAGIPLSTADIIISNGLSSTLITLGQTVQVLSAQITGS
jgi:hypothetical protein